MLAVSIGIIPSLTDGKLTVATTALVPSIGEVWEFSWQTFGENFKLHAGYGMLNELMHSNGHVPDV